MHDVAFATTTTAVERLFDTYEHTFRVNDDIDADSIQAHYEDGVLHIEFKRKPVAESKKIVIQ